MVQVFQNLISNAIKFHGQNPPEINISAKKDKNNGNSQFLIMELASNLEHQKQIFEVFKRLHTREQHPGTGIGLAITQKIIIHHGGQNMDRIRTRKRDNILFYYSNQSIYHLKLTTAL